LASERVAGRLSITASPFIPVATGRWLNSNLQAKGYAAFVIYTLSDRPPAARHATLLPRAAPRTISFMLALSAVTRWLCS
jgi:hypothetical protein